MRNVWNMTPVQGKDCIVQYIQLKSYVFRRIFKIEEYINYQGWYTDNVLSGSSGTWSMYKYDIPIVLYIC